MSPPHNWPGKVQYSASYIYASNVSRELRQFIEGEKTTVPLHARASPVAIKRISDSDHPACGQFGLFATKKIPPNTHIINYIGEVHDDEREESDYDLSLFRSNDVSIGIDASRVGNEARFVNDYRGVPAQERANAAFVEDRVGQLRIRIESTRMIKKGEEILVSYGKAWWKARTGT